MNPNTDAGDVVRGGTLAVADVNDHEEEEVDDDAIRARRVETRYGRGCLSYKAALEARGSDEDVLEEDELIDRDLGRVRSELVDALFATRGVPFKLQTVLASARRVLRAFCTRNPHLGYVQGFHHMVIVLLSEFYDDRNVAATAYEEERAFWVFCALCETIMGNRFYAKDGPRKLQGYMNAVECVSESIGRKKFHGIRSVDKESVVQLLSLKWLLHLWADDAVVSDAAVLKRIWDCVFLSAAGCASMNPPESALRSVYSGHKPLVPRATDFHLRLAVAMIEDTPILAIPEELQDSDDDDESEGYSSPLERCSSDLATQLLKLNVPSPPSTAREPEHPDTSSHSHESGEFADAPFTTRSLRPSPSLQSLQEAPKLRRKASLEEMGAHATGFVYNAVLKRVRKLTLRKLEGLIALAEQIVLLKSDTHEAEAEAEAHAAARGETNEDTSKAVLEFIEKLSSSRNRSVPIRYNTFKRLAITACPTWTVSDIMAVFSTLDVSRSGQVSSHYLIRQLPFRFADRPVGEIESLATAIYTHTAAQHDVQMSQSDSFVSTDFDGPDESCSAGPGGSMCLVQ
ncbi:TBC1 domain family member 2A [Hondaea fermentalgiana]|uniref:TBC1 domain family member 2A n=1 Tax=Hondaea fermentalgiana TaxID=2315210 RepID=A0A2R5GCJ3_9STRA|nr:TBC1 domain family member 2A [Hondaea fermentalgiana]|eukprot:GBG26323.1 TBC1 domain family member 2A [Hondaea fermentalgiana]